MSRAKLRTKLTLWRTPTSTPCSPGCSSCSRRGVEAFLTGTSSDFGVECYAWEAAGSAQTGVQQQRDGSPLFRKAAPDAESKVVAGVCGLEDMFCSLLNVHPMYQRWASNESVAVESEGSASGSPSPLHHHPRPL